MSPHAPKINKLPFLLTDLVFLGAAFAIIIKSPQSIGGSQIIAAVICVALGAWAGITPFLRDHDIQIRIAEADHLKSTVDEIKNLKTVANYIQTATSQWQTLQGNSGKATDAMRDMADRLSADAKDFAESVKKANDGEKQTLRLECEKLKRNEGEGLKIMIALLDHVYALYSAGMRSGQQNVIQQLTGFQLACRDVVRRVGLVPIEATIGDPFDPNVHQAHDGDQQPQPGTPITGALATGYSFQGQMLRPALVTLGPIDDALAAASPEIEPATFTPGEIPLQPSDPQNNESTSDALASNEEAGAQPLA